MRKHGLFLGVLVLAVATRFFVLFHSQTHVNHDEAIVGLMGKHILEGRYYPFYMYGQDYNAGAAWEAYLAAGSFEFFGVGAVPLKLGIVILSLVCLCLFYQMARLLHGPRTAALAALVFALSPSLFQWHFQVRGYSWYFLSLPLLTSLFLLLESRPRPRWVVLFLFGLVSGLSQWGLELGLMFNAALWLLLSLRGMLRGSNALAGAAGFLAGYSPAIVFNLTHHFSNWWQVFMGKTGGEMSVFHAGPLTQIFIEEMPKYFGSDTVYWYHSGIPALGVALYWIALLAIAVASWPFLKAPGKIIPALRGRSTESGESRDFLMLVLMVACFIPYLVALIRVPSYFLGGIFFLAVLMARLIERCLVGQSRLPQFLGAALLLTILAAGVAAIVKTDSRDQIETLTQNQTIFSFRLVQIPGRDISAVERHLRENHITSVWATFYLVYPLIFESDETLVASSAVFGLDRRVYPESVPQPQPKPDEYKVFVMESYSPFRSAIETQCTHATGVPPLITECGSLIIIEEMTRPDSQPSRSLNRPGI